MASFNRVILVGNVTRDIELRYTPSGTAVTDVGLAVNDRVKKGDQWVDETTFVDITLFGRQAEIAGEYLSKGSPALFEGRLKLDTWESDGQKRSKLKVIADKVTLLGSRQGGGGGGGSGSAPNRPNRGSAQTSRAAADSGGYHDYDQSGPSDEDVPF